MEENKDNLENFELVTVQIEQIEKSKQMINNQRREFQRMLDSVNKEQKVLDLLHKELEEKEKKEKKEKKEESRKQQEKYKTNSNPLLKQRKLSLQDRKLHIIAMLQTIRKHKMIENMHNRSIYEEIQELGSTDILEIKQMTKFCKTAVGKRFIRKKLQIQPFGLKVYLYPNGTNENDKTFVQFQIKLNQIPSDIKYFVVYCKLLCIQTNTEYRCTQKCDNKEVFIGWWAKLLPLKKCQQFDKLQFKYDIQILQICYNRDKITDHVKPQCGLQRLIDVVYPWYIEKKVFTTMKYCKYISLFYQQYPYYDGICVSMGCMACKQKKNKQIIVSFHFFKLPPKVQKLTALCELTLCLNTKIKLKKEYTFNHSSTKCEIPLDKKYSDRLLAASEQNYCAQIAFILVIKVKKVWFRDFMDLPHEIHHNHKHHEIKKKNKENEKSKSKSISPEKSTKNAKYIKRGHTNHKHNKQRKRNNKKQKTKSMKLTKKEENEENNDNDNDNPTSFKLECVCLAAIGGDVENMLNDQKERIDIELKYLENFEKQ